LGRLHPFEQADPRVDHRRRRDQAGEADDGGHRPALDDRVDRLPGDDGCRNPEHGGDRGQDEERDDRRPVGLGEREDPPDRAPTDGSAGLAVLHGALQRHPHVEVAHRCGGLPGVARKGATGNGTTSTALEVKGIRPAPRYGL
jgi:hypothetical protein